MAAMLVWTSSEVRQHLQGGIMVLVWAFPTVCTQRGGAVLPVLEGVSQAFRRTCRGERGERLGGQRLDWHNLSSTLCVCSPCYRDMTAAW
jgi:hypothetical protein